MCVVSSDKKITSDQETIIRDEAAEVKTKDLGKTWYGDWSLGAAQKQQAVSPLSMQF